MSTKIRIIAVTISLIIFLNQPAYVQAGQLSDDVAAACKTLKQTIGYGCDGPLERFAWRAYLRLRYDVTDCNSFCRNYRKKRSGRCAKVQNYDNSSWCAQGQTCTCS
ncbi:unnamed protein product [Adineta ricciae]|uniref:Uncharacterized protein n=1 Tax=Adineta ricciae TaxID=249248 RepID=A0A813YL90_ADIRI|nr:unnamed protein product [Adineta ricciae]CAF0977310.1 unnamed protein product [Adineta ricciae]